MKALGLTVTIDAIGNVIGLREGREKGAPVVTGSHIDTVRTGGRYDSNYGVLAGPRSRALNDASGHDAPSMPLPSSPTKKARVFHPDMMGSLVYAGGIGLDEAHAATDKEGCRSAMSCAASAISGR